MNLEEVRRETSYHMDQIISCFKHGAKIAVIVRTPGDDEADFMLTDDDLDELQKVIERMKGRLPAATPPLPQHSEER